MKYISSVIYVALALAGFARPAWAADTNAVIADLNALVSRVNAKLAQGKDTEKDFSGEIKDFDVLYAKYKDQKTEDVAQILLAKAQIYLEVLSDPLSATGPLKQIKANLPGTPTGKRIDDILASLQPAIEKEKIQLTLVPGRQFPDFSEKDLSGQPLSVSEFKGNILLVDFWATWCPPCRAELPGLIALYNKYHAQGFDIIGINLDDESGKVQDFVKSQGMDWPQYFDGLGWDNKLVAKYGVSDIPTTYLLDRNGMILAKGLRGVELEAAVAKAMAGK